MTLRESRRRRPVVAFAAAAIGLAVVPTMAGPSAEDTRRRAAPVVDEQGQGGQRERGPAPGDMNAEQTDRSVRTLAIGPTGWLELRNLAGDITVTASPGREARVEIIRRARGQTEATAKLGLERTRVVIDHKGDRAIVAVDPGAERRQPYFVRVMYVVSAPAGTRIVASSLSGNVHVTDIKGDITAHVTRGDVEIRGASLVSSIKTIDGDVTVTDLVSERGLAINVLSGDVRLERVRARRVEVDASSGDVDLSGLVAEAVQVTSLEGSIEYQGGLSAGGRYHFQTFSGNVTLALTGPTGMELQASTFRGNLRLDSSLNLKTPIASRGSVRGTVGDGAATVVITAFSGDVIVGRK